MALLGSLAAAITLAVLHLLAPHLRTLPGVPERRVGSFAGGLAVAYVFLHLLPDMAQGNEAIGEVLRQVIDPTPLFDLAVFAMALVGFTTFYGLERLAVRAGRAERAEPSAMMYCTHLGAFLGYNFLITYTMELRFSTDITFAVLFTIAMALHFVLTDRGLQRHYPHRFSRNGRYLLVAALLAGWVFSAVLAPTNVVVVSVLTALLSGSILLNVFKEELPEGRTSSFGWFLAGLLLYAALLTTVTALGE